MNSDHSLLATKEDIARLEMKLSSTFLGVDRDIFMWMFIFWIGQIASAFGFILLFLKH